MYSSSDTMDKQDDVYVIGIDLGGTSLHCAVLDQGCKILCRTTRPARADLPAGGLVDNIAGAIAETIEQFHDDGTKIKAIGIGLPGIVYSERGVLHRAANFPKCHDLALAAQVSETAGRPTFLGHDVDLAALAEMHYGAGRGKKHIICLTVGTGIGAGMIFNRQPYTGHKHGAGNLGHMVVDKHVPVDRVAEDAIVERLSAAPAIRARAIQAIRDGAESSLTERCRGDLEAIDTRMVFDAAEVGDAVSCEIVGEALRVLGIAIANAYNLLSPEVIIIGGGMAQAGEPFFRKITEVADQYVYHYPDMELNIVPAEVGDNAVLLGAGRLAWDELQRTA